MSESRSLKVADRDSAIRLAAFNWLKEQTAIHGDVLPRKTLEKGFIFESERIPLIAPQGIFKPKMLDLPLSITTAPRGPYDDNFDEQGFLIYKYRGTDINHRDNVGLRVAMMEKKPLIYLHGVVPGKYLATWPVFIIGDDKYAMAFQVAVDEIKILQTDETDGFEITKANEIRRAYMTSKVKIRLHQRSFREKVLEAYQTQCALCRLRHAELLDAAHIIPDSHPDGEAKVSNGISLCKFHHAAYDSQLLAISPDFIVLIRSDILLEKDGPMLQHGLKALHDTKIILPNHRNQWPDRNLLDVRYQQFNKAA
jgi:putative restriction endonuclease